MTAQVTAQLSHDAVMAEADRLIALGEALERTGRDPVNQPMINNWVEAMGDTNPRWRNGEAPPAMAQVWTMYGLTNGRDRRLSGDPLHAMMAVLTEAGFTGVLGTNSEQTYARTLKVGEEVRVTTRLESVVGPKATGMGEGYFVTSINTWYSGDEEVATMLFRVFKFVPKVSTELDQRAADTFVLRPMKNRDTEYFWEGTAAGELRIQQCNACQALRHPPGPACPSCGALDRGYVVASGRGTLFSYVVHRHPPVPGRELPILLALVDLEEGVRMVGELTGVPVDEVEIGMPVAVNFCRVDDDLTLPNWTRA